MNHSQTSHRDTIALQDAEIIQHDAFDGDQFILRLHAPECAELARPGQFVHINCGPELAMRRPISIMLTNPEQGWIDLLYKAVGSGTRILSQRQVGDKLSVLGPIGQPFKPDQSTRKALLIGGGVGMPPMIFLASALRKQDIEPFVILGSEVPFPFWQTPSRLVVPGMPDGVIGSMPLLEDWQVAARLASLQGYPGCFEGYVTDLARHWLDTIDPAHRNEIEVFACGPHPMLEATSRLSAEYDLRSQLSLEEYMACGVGGCAGCVVEISDNGTSSMKRVCVDGPVFDARGVYPEHYV